MGTRGPIPKRSELSRGHRTKAELAAVEKPTVVAVVPVVQPDADPSWQPMARDWYTSLAHSGQAVYYQPSDWQTARVWAEVLSRQLTGSRLSAQMIAAWSTAAGELLTTEGSRRRAKLELQTALSDDDEDAALAAVTDISSRFGG